MSSKLSCLSLGYNFALSLSTSEMVGFSQADSSAQAPAWGIHRGASMWPISKGELNWLWNKLETWQLKFLHDSLHTPQQVPLPHSLHNSQRPLVEIKTFFKKNVPCRCWAFPSGGFLQTGPVSSAVIGTKTSQLAVACCQKSGWLEFWNGIISSFTETANAFYHQKWEP